MNSTEKRRVSVLMPAHNAETTIAAAIDSVLAQTLEEWELIVVDDGSSDSTTEICRGFDNSRIRLVSQERRGPSAARNTAFAHSRAELIAFLDADDLFHPRKLESQVKFLEDHPSIGSTYCRHRRIDAAGVPWTVNAPKVSLSAADFLAGFPFNPSSQVVRRRFHQAVSGFDESLSINEDRDYWLRLAAGGCRFGLTKEVLADYRLHQAGRSFRRDGLEQSLAVLARHERIDAAIAQSSRVAAIQESAFQAAASGDMSFAKNCMEEVLRQVPDLLSNSNQRDDFMQSIVDCAVRTRCERDPIIRAIFQSLENDSTDWSDELDWALGSAAVVSGARELIWGRTDAATAALRAGADRSAQLDKRTQRLVRWDLAQVREAFGDDSWRTLRARFEDALKLIDSDARIRALLDSAEDRGSRQSIIDRLRAWWPTVNPR